MYFRILAKILLCLFFGNLPAQDQVYELRTYELEFFRPAEVLHNYFEKALIPALNRQGIKQIGVFEEYGEGLPKKMYLLIPYKNLLAFQASKDNLTKDNTYLEDASAYLNANEASIPYKRITTRLIRSTYGFPNLVKPNFKAHLFELRIYESHNEDALRRKVNMFNDSEFKIFEEVGLPMVFFGDNIAGDQMPCLTYLLAFEDMNAQMKAWSKFGPHPEWQRIIKLEKYANSMNDITRVFLKPLPYSQL
ncbi:NIPSNAP protein [Flavobacteriaceae bacterium MAR_2010_72]|nr:NIPSNAP protein [Flavobacteriaceae bacterium MAR_2010_72]TVZ60250.1 NIPSNAP protein [Flavobacteriaceae bacterium MAR_2010_105]